ncbi:hypothetical protein TRFO_03557 [Tritrichomonas foetus]|uniref:Uncharacterized protein n=1 Tax=Tritrichomonas foetus TaxID=1144522 RepID=A0A1J4KSB6_9EUKA|nr:hypothetical protein TRFO_03557 [Tritrichomonas foetus]|eukprot:OHT12558.1 hypothetical protein TRFO_03557 [Tritrichomonas foetus]
MNQTQVQVFRLLLRNLQTSLVDLSYAFALKAPHDKVVNPYIEEIDNTLRSLLSTFDDNEKHDIVQYYLKDGFEKVLIFQNQYGSTIKNEIKNLKNDFFIFLQKESEENNVPFNAGEVNMKLTQINFLQNPFSDLSVPPPFVIEEFLMSFNRNVPFKKEKAQYFFTRVNFYNYFFTFLRQIQLISNYKVKFDEGDIPSDCSHQFVNASTENDDQTTKEIMPLAKSSKNPPQMNWGMVKFDDELYQNNCTNSNTESNMPITSNTSNNPLNILKDSQNNENQNGKEKKVSSSVSFDSGSFGGQCSKLMNLGQSKPLTKKQPLTKQSPSFNPKMSLKQQLSMCKQPPGSTTIKPSSLPNSPSLSLSPSPPQLQTLPTNTTNESLKVAGTINKSTVVYSPTSSRNQRNHASYCSYETPEEIEKHQKHIREWNEIIIARLEQKTVLLIKESQMLKQNLDILSKQKAELIEVYEEHMNELLRQNALLKSEHSKLKEKSYSQASDDESMI